MLGSDLSSNPVLIIHCSYVPLCISTYLFWTLNWSTSILYFKTRLSPSTLVHLLLLVSSSFSQRARTCAMRSCRSSSQGSSSRGAGPQWQATELTCRRSRKLCHTFQPAPCPVQSSWSVWGLFLAGGGMSVFFVDYSVLTWWTFHGPLPKRRVGDITAGTPQLSTWYRMAESGGWVK